jgi:adenylate cyclase
VSRLHWRDTLAALVIALVSGLVFASPTTDIAHSLSIDALTALRWQLFGQREKPEAAPTAVIVLDEESFNIDPFKGSLVPTWTPEIGKVLTAVIDGGAKVVGFDIIFPTLIEQSKIPFDGETLGARLRGFDRDFLRALAIGARAEKVVLGEVLQRERPIGPSPGQRIAVGRDRNIRALNTYSDPDYVVRRLPLAFPADKPRTPSMAVELASRALGAAPEIAADGSATKLAGYRIPSAVPNTITLNFEGGADAILTYSFADLHACVEKGDTEFFRLNFDGKVVLFGTLLDTRDRRVTSKRFATGLEGARAPRCALPMQPTAAQFTGNSIAGVYVHATGVNNLIRRNALVEPSRIVDGLIAIAFAGLTAFAAILFAPVSAVLAYVGLAAAWIAGATVAFTQTLALPLVEPFLAGFAALSAAIGYRFIIADKEERFLRHSFGLYLAPQVIDKMLSANKLPALGGEMRDVTLFFSDIVSFSSIAETMTPNALVALLNEYLSAMTDIIEEHGGYVEKYSGDSIGAVFGAPVDDADHARNAVRAALMCRARLEQMNQMVGAFQGCELSHRIGLNSGEALAGNIGSRRRFNYTVMSDAVNLASRLEGANKYFGTSIMASEGTVKLTGTTFAWRELDAIRVKGRIRPVKIYDLLAEFGRESPEQAARAAIYAEGLACWRARDFAGAVRCFARIADVDPPAARFIPRAQQFAAHPPGPDWEPVFTLEGK